MLIVHRVLMHALDELGDTSPNGLYLLPLAGWRPPGPAGPVPLLAAPWPTVYTLTAGLPPSREAFILHPSAFILPPSHSLLPLSAL